MSLGGTLVVAVVKEWLQEESQRTQVVGVGASIGEEVQPEEESEGVDLLSSLPVKAYPFQVMASQGMALLLFVAKIGLLVVEAIWKVELGQQLERKQCSPHSLRMRSRCWSRFLFWVRLQCWKFLKEEQFVDAVAGIRASQGGVFGISLVLRLFL